MLLKRLETIVVVIAMATPIGVLIYAAQPWAKLEPSTSIGTGVLLLLLIGWAVSRKGAVMYTYPKMKV